MQINSINAVSSNAKGNNKPVTKVKNIGQQTNTQGNNIYFQGGKEMMRLIPSSIPGSLEKNIAERLGIIPSKTVIKKFANGETYVNILEDMRNKDVLLCKIQAKPSTITLWKPILKQMQADVWAHTRL